MRSCPFSLGHDPVKALRGPQLGSVGVFHESGQVQAWWGSAPGPQQAARTRLVQKAYRGYLMPEAEWGGWYPTMWDLGVDNDRQSNKTLLYVTMSPTEI